MSKNLLITGASSDLALSMLPELSESFDNIIAHFHTSDAKIRESVSDKCGLITLSADFTSNESTNEFIKKVSESGINVTHILHCPSSRFSYNKYSKVTWNEFERLIETQVRSFYFITNAFLPAMAKNKYGKIVAVLSSVTIGTPPAAASHYVTAKYALEGLVKALASEYAGKNIQINGISPSMMETKFNSEIPHLLVEKSAISNPAGRNANTSDVTPLIRYLLSDENTFMTGQNLCVNGGALQ